MKILITGGHFSPALALIEYMGSKADVAVAGRKFAFEGDTAETLEYKICRARKIPFFPIRAGRFQRAFTRHTVPSLMRLPVGFFEAMKALESFRPDVVVTFGGYIALPVAYAAWVMKIPVVAHEQTMGAGAANKLIAKIAKKVCISFESSKSYFPKEKIVMTGNPIREDVFKIEKSFEVPKDRPVLYITGGSTGSHILNAMIESVLEKLVSTFTIIHQTGDSQEFLDYTKLLGLRDSLPTELQKHYILKKFITGDEIGFVLKTADLVIARSGINTVSELLATETVGLFIPLATGQKNEQLGNAAFVKKIGLGDYILQKELTGDKLLAKASEMIENLPSYEKNKTAAGSFIVKNASGKLFDSIQSIYEAVQTKKVRNKTVV